LRCEDIDARWRHPVLRPVRVIRRLPLWPVWGRLGRDGTRRPQHTSLRQTPTARRRLIPWHRVEHIPWLSPQHLAHSFAHAQVQQRGLAVGQLVTVWICRSVCLGTSRLRMPRSSTMSTSRQTIMDPVHSMKSLIRIRQCRGTDLDAETRYQRAQGCWWRIAQRRPCCSHDETAERPRRLFARRTILPWGSARRQGS
jgi:hypothetical protein